MRETPSDLAAHVRRVTVVMRWCAACRKMRATRNGVYVEHETRTGARCTMSKRDAWAAMPEERPAKLLARMHARLPVNRRARRFAR